MTIKLYKPFNSDYWHFSSQGKIHIIIAGSLMIDNIAKFFKKDSLYIQLKPNDLQDSTDFGCYLIGNWFYPTDTLKTFYNLINGHWNSICITEIPELYNFKIIDIW